MAYIRIKNQAFLSSINKHAGPAQYNTEVGAVYHLILLTSLPSKDHATREINLYCGHYDQVIGMLNLSHGGLKQFYRYLAN